MQGSRQRYNGVLSYLSISAIEVLMRMCVLVINYATSGRAPLLGSAGTAAARSASHTCVMTHAKSGSAVAHCYEVRYITSQIMTHPAPTNGFVRARKCDVILCVFQISNAVMVKVIQIYRRVHGAQMY